MDSFVPFAEPMLEQPLFPFYQTFDCNPILAKTSMDKADSGLTYNIPAPRKRHRDSINELDTFSPVSQNQKLSRFSSFLDQDTIFQLQQHQQSEIYRYIAQHRMELEEGVVKTIKEKDEEIQRMEKLNWVLQEKVKSLYVENQIWRELAQKNEATANILRNNLEQVLAQVGDDHDDCGGVMLAAATAGEDDAESSCGSTSDFGGNRMCRRCGERESSVLLLPCRHLCLCTVCGCNFSLIGSCPVCISDMDAALHVNIY